MAWLGVMKTISRAGSKRMNASPLRTKAQFAYVVAVLLAVVAQTSPAQPSKALTRSDVDQVMTNMVKEFNSKMAGTRVDEMTVIRMMTYDKAVPTLGYHYGTAYFKSTGQRNVSPEHRAALRSFHVEKTCSSNFRVFMKSYKLEVVHTFADTDTGRNLAEIRISNSDCTS